MLDGGVAATPPGMAKGMRDHQISWRLGMGKFTIQPHGRLQEWIADQKGYFRDEGLDYELSPGLSASSEKKLDASGGVAEVRSGAFESYKQAGGNKGVKSDISCA